MKNKILILVVLLPLLLALNSCKKEVIFEEAEFRGYGGFDGACGVIIQNEVTGERVKPIDDLPIDLPVSMGINYWIKLKYLNKTTTCMAADQTVELKPGNEYQTIEIELVEILEMEEIE